MTKKRLPDVCDLCGKDIESEKQYVSEWFEGRSTFGDERSRAKNKVDCCHKCFLAICEHGYAPEWIHEIKNVNFISGSKKANDKFFIPKPDPSTQEKLT